MSYRALFFLALATLAGCAAAPQPTSLLTGELRRTPAEWEPQDAVWLQWPQSYEGDAVEQVFVSIVSVLAEYETVQLLAADQATQDQGEAALAGIAGDIRWHIIPNDASWMRDNGPRYVELDGALVLQNWEFNAYQLGLSPAEYTADNDSPDAVAALLDLPLEHVGLVHERGDLEVNGSDTALVNWSVVSHRNPGVTRADATAEFTAALGVERVIYIEGFDPSDITRGHTDGLARFVSDDTVVVADHGALSDRVAAQIAEHAPDLRVERLELYPEDPVINWLIGDGFLLTGSTTDPVADAEIADELRGWFPSRDIHFVDVSAIWANGGGVHCVTNDQPSAP
ncbi:MAG: agmatine deiminase family protein [Deltaproteobacteria bacterium]|nr:agmatine deiminase family protein [Deltaproteobacteria bacterium]